MTANWQNIAARYESGEVDGSRRDHAHAHVVASRISLATAKVAMGNNYGSAVDHLQTVANYRPLQRVLKRNGTPWVTQFQQHGTCVGQAFANAIRRLLARLDEAGVSAYPGAPAVAGTYAGGRQEANQLGRWDGSSGSWVIDWLTGSGGVLLKKDLGLAENDLDGDESLAVKWAAQGVPRDKVQMASAMPLLHFWKIEDTTDAAIALNLGGLVSQGSNLWADGDCNAAGISRCRVRRGGHEQLVDAYRADDGAFFQQNSWGDGFGEGCRFLPDNPPGGVGITGEDFQRQIDQGDCYAIFCIGMRDGHAASITDHAV